MTQDRRWLAIGCCVLAAGLGVNSLLGPLATGVIEYRYTETFENQAIGLDAFVLAIAAPLLGIAAALVLRGYAAAPLVALGPAVMAAYMLPQYVLGAHYAEIDGNNEDFFVLQLALFVLSVVVGVLAWNAVEPDTLPQPSTRFRRWTAALLFAVALFLVVRYAPMLVDIWRDTPADEYVDDPIAFWIIAFMDLGIIMPAAVAGGWAQLAGARSAGKLMYAIVAWFALVGPAVAAMGFAMVARDDPHGSLGGAVTFAAFGAVFAALAAWLFIPLFRRSA